MVWNLTKPESKFPLFIKKLTSSTKSDSLYNLTFAQEYNENYVIYTMKEEDRIGGVLIDFIEYTAEIIVFTFSEAQAVEQTKNWIKESWGQALVRKNIMWEE